MTPDKPDSFRIWFKDYVSGFFQNDPDFNRAIKLKENHTYRVCKNIQTLCESLNLCKNDIDIAFTSALFHDIGRFLQFARYQTFNDNISCNHARLGVKILGLKRVLQNLPITERRLISKSIAFHNAVHVPDHLDTRQSLLIRLLRDADKLDIWQVMIDHYRQYRKNPKNAVFLNLPDRPECSGKILEAIFEGRFARTQDLATLNDFKLLQISWVFDLNFPAAFKIIKKKEFIKELADGLPAESKVNLAVRKALEEVDRGCNLKRLGEKVSDL